jgi:integrase
MKYRLPGGRQVERRLAPDWRQRSRPPNGYSARKTAAAALREVLADAQRGRLAGQARSGATFGQAVEEWLRYVEHDRACTRSTVADYTSVARGSLLPAFGRDIPLEELTPEALDAYRSRLLAEGRLSNRTIQKQIVLLGGSSSAPSACSASPSNPALLVERPPVHRTGEFDVLTPAEVEALARAAESEQDAALYTTAGFTGLRLGELRALRWSDVDFSKRLVHVRRGLTRQHLGHTKSHPVRSVPLIDQVARALDRLSRRENFTGPDDWVFVNSVGNPLDDSKLRRRFYRALDHAGLKRIRFHDLRHSFGTLDVQVFPLSDVKAYMGQADIETTMIYVHHVPADDAAHRVSRAVQGSGDFRPDSAGAVGDDH